MNTKRIALLALLGLFALNVSAQQAKPSLWDKVKQKVKENVSVNGTPRAQPASTAAPSAANQKNDLWRRFWNEPTYTPATRNGAAHLRVGYSSAGQFNGGVPGEITCDMAYLFAGKSGIAMDAGELDRCAMIKYRLARQTGTETAIDADTSAGKTMALDKYRPVAKARIDYLAKQETFWFRPNFFLSEKRFVADKQALELQFDFPPLVIALPHIVGGGYKGPEWGTVRWDQVARRYQDMGRIDTTNYTVRLKMDPMEAQWFEKSFAGPESEAYFTVKRAWLQALGGASRVALMEVDATRIELAMRQGVNWAPARPLVFGSDG